jgi:hypothetical protein|tara:strand:+ start:177 stop:386 length:210 start_codon:yes stop_codon:yes gene_type:complete
MKEVMIKSTNNAAGDIPVATKADVLSKSDKHMRVVLKNTTVTLELHRTDVRQPYIGRLSGLEFKCDEVE